MKKLAWPVLALAELTLMVVTLPLFVVAFFGLKRDYRWAEILMGTLLSLKMLFYSPKVALGFLKGVYKS